MMAASTTVEELSAAVSYTHLVEIVDYEELSEKAEEVEQADLEAKQAEFRENNPAVSYTHLDVYKRQQ